MRIDVFLGEVVGKYMKICNKSSVKSTEISSIQLGSKRFSSQHQPPKPCNSCEISPSRIDILVFNMHKEPG